MPTERAATGTSGTEAGHAAPPEPGIAAVATWLGQFSRTLKTCRLYDSANPTALKFRQDLADGLRSMLDRVGAVTLRFSATDVRCDEHVVFTAHTRDDNLAMPFHRDGLRTLTLQPGVEPRELDVLLDLLLQVTRRADPDAGDLVTLLWDEDLPHVDMSYVAAEANADLLEGGGATAGQHAGDGALLPWPGAALAPTQEASVAPLPEESPAPEAGEPAQPLACRSEDWLAGEAAGELEASYAALDAASDGERARFTAAFERDRALRPGPAAVELVRDALRTPLREGDEAELASLLTRALVESIAAASWPDAQTALDALETCAGSMWDAAAMLEQFSQPDAPETAALVRRLDAGTLAELNAFADFGRRLGPIAIEWLMGIVAASEHQRTRRLLVRTLGELCQGNPERLAPWLGDPRWYVVRNAVLVVGSAEGVVPAGLLRAVAAHPEPRVRQEVVAALARADADAARPLLLRFIHDGEPAIRTAALHALGQSRNAQAAEALLALVRAADFRKRPAEEVRPILTALGGCGGDEALPVLEEQLYPPGWLHRNAGPYCLAVARCIARIHTPLARAVLERGTRSRIAATRDACRMALGGTHHE